MTKLIKRLSAIAAAILIITLSIMPTFAAPTGTYVENNSTITEYKRLFHGSIRSTWATYDNRSVLLPVDIQDTWNNPPATPTETDPLQGTWVLNEYCYTLSNQTQFYFNGSVIPSTFYGATGFNNDIPILGSLPLQRFVIYGDDTTSATYNIYSDISVVYPLSRNSWRTHYPTAISVSYWPKEGEFYDKLLSMADYPDLRVINIGMTSQEFIERNGQEKYVTFVEWLQSNATKQAAAPVDFPNSPTNSMATPFTNITLDGITVPTYSTEWAAEFPEEQRFIFNLTDLMLPSGLYTDANLMIWNGQFFGKNNTRAAEIRVRDMSTEAIYAEWRGRLYFYDSTGIISIVRDVEEAIRFSDQFVFDDITLAGSNAIPADYDYWSFEGDVSFTIDSDITGSETLRMYFDGVENSFYYSDGSLENSTTTNPVNAFYNAIALGGTGSGGTGTLTIYENGLYNVSNYAYVQASIPQEVTNAELPNLFAFLGDAISGFFAVEIFPGFSIGGILVFAAGVAMLFFILKVFMGG